MHSYDKLTNIVNTNLQEHNIPRIHFEIYENLFESIYTFPASKLLAVESDVNFVNELYYKILNRPVDAPTLKHLLHVLNTKKTSREKLLQSIYSSEEQKVKETALIFDKEEES